MFSYIIGGLAVLIFLSNPITNFFYPETSHSRPSLSKPPHLNESLLAINHPNDTFPECLTDSYIAHILKAEPLVIYLENFLSESDRRHLLEIRSVS
jgi:hypothetical protein